MTTFAEPPFDIRVALAIDGGWQYISDDVLYANGIKIRRGSGFDTPRLEATNATLTLKNPAGKYMRTNPMGPWFGKLTLNNPARVDRVMVTTEFNVDSASGWSPTDQGWPWLTAGGGGTVSSTDWSVLGGAAQHSIPAANAYRLSYIEQLYRNPRVLATFQLPTANVTGAPVGAAILLRGQSTTNYIQVNAIVAADDTIGVSAGDATSLEPPFVWPTGIVNTGQPLTLAAVADDQTVAVKLWVAGTPEPVDWILRADGQGETYPEPGFIGLKSLVFTGNTNTMPFVMKWLDFRVERTSIVGVIPDWAPKWDKSGRFEHMPIEIAGMTRQLENNKQPLNSCLRQALPTTPGLVYYIPCEEEQLADSLASAIPGHPAMTCGTDSGSPPNFAGYSGFIASKPLPTVGDARWRGAVPMHTTTGTYQLRFLQHISASGMDDNAIIAQFFTTGTASCWEYRYKTGGGCTLVAFDQSGTQILTLGTFTFGMNDKKCRVSYELTQDGADIDYLIAAPEEGENSPGAMTGTLAGYTIGRIYDIRFAVGNPTVQYNDLAIGHITLSTSANPVLDMYQEFQAFDGELAYFRAQRLCRENNINLNVRTAHALATEHVFSQSVFGTTPMGPQPVATILECLNECVEAEEGALVETHYEHNGITFITHRALENQRVGLLLNLGTDHELNGEFEPDEATDRRYNDITAERKRGSSFRVEQTTGPYAVSIIGRRPRPYPLNVQADSQLPDQAYWLRETNTVDEYLFSSISVDLNNSSLKSNAVKYRNVLDLDLYERLVVESAQGRMLFNDIEQLPRGVTEELDQFTHKFTWNTIPGRPYITLELGDSELDVLDTTGYTILEGIDDNDTTFHLVQGLSEPLWSTTDPPDQVVIGGEVMDLSSITNVVPSFVAVGTAGHADNAAVGAAQGLGLPGGATAGGDLLLMLVTSRSGAHTYSITNGYSLLWFVGDVQFFAKIHSGSETVPTVTPSGGAAGDTLSVQIASLHNVPAEFIAGSQSFNGGTPQNIAFPGLYWPLANWIAIYWGRKSDDCTSVDTIPGATEIDEEPTTVGSDQTTVWGYRIGTDHCALPAGSFVVNGGTGAQSRGGILLLGNRQLATIGQRSVNNVVNIHAAGSQIRPWPQPLLGLGNYGA